MIINVNQFKTEISVSPGTICYLGASSSPSRAIIISVTDNTVTYTCYPYYELRYESVKFFRITATLGTKNRIAQLESQRAAALKGEKFAFYGESLDHERLYLIDVMAGKSVAAIDYHSEQTVKAFVVPTDNSLADHWSIIGRNGFDVCGESNGFYEIWLPRKDIPLLKSLQGYEVADIRDNP